MGIGATALFSTSMRIQARPVVPSGRAASGKNLKSVAKKTLKIKKKAPVKTGKPPASGERKAMRKRIVLSNTNALEVKGMRDLDEGAVEEMVSTKDVAEEEVLAGALGMVGGEDGGKDWVGKVVGLKGETVDSLRAVEAFKTTQGWGLFRRPALLVREESVIVSRKLVEGEKVQGVRLLIDGERVTGKSLLLLHAMATAFLRGWVVVNIPEGISSLFGGLNQMLIVFLAQEVVNAMNDYAAIPGTKPTLWSQPTYTANLLGQIGKANNTLLQGMEVTQQHNLPIPLQSNISLFRLCELGARDPDVAWPFFQAFWSEITAEGRPPVLMCLDGLSHIMQNSLYRAPDYSLIHAHDLAIVRHFIDYFSGSKKLPNGGATIAATNRSHAPVSKTLNLAIKQVEEKAKGEEISQKDPFEKTYDARAEKVLGNFEVLRLKGLSKKEARGLMEYWAQSGVLRSRIDEGEVAEKWALAGNGNVGEIERGALRMRI